MNSNDSFVPPRLIPLSKWNEHHDYPTVSSLRHLVFFEEKNGFSKVLRRIGKKIYIDEKSFFEWVEELNSIEVKKAIRPSLVGERKTA